MVAWIAGLEVCIRMAVALKRPHYDSGWHVTGTAGTVGAVVAAARLLELDQSSFANALGIASTQAMGHRVQFGAMTKSLHAGMAGANGIMSAVLASEGFTASEESFEGPAGMFAAMASLGDPGLATDGLGSSWLLEENMIKPYACGVVTHPVIDGARALREELHLEATDLAAIVVRVHPFVVELTGKERPRTELEAKFSARHCAAVGFLFGGAGPREFSPEVVTDPAVVAFRDRIEIVLDPSMPHMTTVVLATTQGGQTQTVEVQHARGTPGRPLSEADVVEKFVGLVGSRLGSDHASELAVRLLQAEGEPSIKSLVDATIVGG
jgi:2-methylcitrate dehydratase PrpD